MVILVDTDIFPSAGGLVLALSELLLNINCLRLEMKNEAKIKKNVDK